jgi:Ca2+-binding RTX toxin-like protein
MALIYGSDGPEHIQDTDRQDTIYGMGGDDTISAGSGSDQLFGGSGNDMLEALYGGNRLDGGEGFDIASYPVGTGIRADLRSGSVTFNLNWDADSLSGIEGVRTSSGHDVLIGDDAANLFEGDAGGDRLLGNLGADTLSGGRGSDVLNGGAGNDALNGDAGNDTVAGGSGDDVITVGPNDHYDSDSGAAAFVDQGIDAIDGGDGNDTLLVQAGLYWPREGGEPFGPFTIARVNLGAGTLRIGEGERSSIASIENVTTGAGDDTIVGSAAANFIFAGAGANVVFGGGGGDTIIGGSETIYPNDHEMLHGGGGDDLIISGGNEELWDLSDSDAGRDFLDGGAGNDTLQSGAAYQTMTGGTGSDVFVITDDLSYEGHGIDYISFHAPSTITDFNRAADRIELDFAEAVTFAGEIEKNEVPDVYSVGYYHDGADTVVRANLYSDLEIRLAEYTGPLTADDLGL